MELIDSYPGLLDRLTSGEEEDVIHVGELVSFVFWKFVMLTVYSSVKEPLVHEATIPSGTACSPPIHFLVLTHCITSRPLVTAVTR
jgi:hypothetical protein